MSALLERLLDSTRALGPQGREHVRLEPFTAFIDHDQTAKWFSFAVPDSGTGPEAASTVPALAEAFADRGRVGRIEVFDELCPKLPAVLEAAGWTRVDHVPVMVCTPDSFVMPPVPEGVEVVVPASDASDELVQQWHHTQVIAFEDPPPIAPMAVDWFRDRAATRFLAAAIVNGVVVGTAECSPITAGVVDVGGVATLPEHRGRGIGGFLTGSVVRAAFAAGADVAWLAAAPEGARIYARAGFSISGTQSIYDAPDG